MKLIVYIKMKNYGFPTFFTRYTIENKERKGTPYKTEKWEEYTRKTT